MNKTSLLTAMIGSAALLGGVGMTHSSGPAPSTPAPSAQDAKLPCEVSVVGVGEMAVEPDRAQVVLGAVFEADTAGEAQHRVNRVLGQIIEDVRELEIEGTLIQTASISIQPVYDRPRNQAPRVKGYRASNTVSVQVDDISQIGRVMDVGVAREANQGYGVTFMLQDRAAAERDAMRLAVDTARQKAEVIASALDRGSMRVVRVTEQGAEPPRPVMQRGVESMAMRSMDAAPTPVEGGKITVRAQVTMDCVIGD